MSVEAIRLPRRSGATALLPLAAGLLLLLLRVEVLTAGSARDVLLIAGYFVLLAVSLAPALQTRATAGVLPAAAVVLLGTGAVAAISIAPWQTRIVTPWGAGALALGVLAAVAEEAFFRRLLFDRLLRAGATVAVIGSAIAFALVHVPLYGTSVLWLDLGAGLLLAWQRWAADSWTAPAITHAVANVLAVIR